MKRLIEQTLCEHDEIEPHVWFTEKKRLTRECPGGSSREITVDYEAAAERLDAEIGGDIAPTLRKWPNIVRDVAQEVVDAALGGGR